jgi:tetratricopeptide (TPR) repeat protein
MDAAVLTARFKEASALHRSGMTYEALRACEGILDVQPDHSGALVLLGIIQLQAGQPRRALELLSRSLAADPENAGGHSILGNALVELGNPTAAIQSYSRAIALHPGYCDAYYNRGNALLDLGRADAALDDYDQVLALRPDFALVHRNRGIALTGCGRFEEALASFDSAIAAEGGSPAAHYNRGRALHGLLRLPEAVESYGEAIAAKPDYAGAYVNRAIASLAMGDFEHGWSDFEWRWQSGGTTFPPDVRHAGRPLWLGEGSVAGKTILLHAEQGLGDTLQFCRYCELVANLGATVILEVPESLAGLCASLPGVARVIAQGDVPPPFDLQCPLMSLPFAFGTQVATIPARIPYLHPADDIVRRWREKLGETHRLRVGLAWSGGFRPDRPDLWPVNARRNIPLAKLATLRHPDIDFVSLQKGQHAEAELGKLIAQNWEGPALIDHSSELQDFAATAALMANLDLVISVDTSTAHLAGALGRPVWILNRFDSCWRWLLGREDSPWYPTARIYRQRAPGDWDEVIGRVRADLARRLVERSTRP